MKETGHISKLHCYPSENLLMLLYLFKVDTNHVKNYTNLSSISDPFTGSSTSLFLLVLSTQSQNTAAAKLTVWVS